MRDAVELLSRMGRLGVKLWVEGERLRFSAPPAVLTPELRNELAESKAALLTLLRTAPTLPRLVPDPERRDQPFPLTDIQQAYWVGRGQGMDLGGVSTHVYFELEREGLDTERLERAWNRLVARHEMLRAIILPRGEQQLLREVPPYRIAVVDLRGEGEETATRRLEAIREQMSHQVLPADRWPLFELRVTRLPGGKDRLHISIDVMIVDGSSMTRLFQEWAGLYEEPDRELPALELSFRDYILAEEKIRETALYQQSKDYWLSRLESLPPGPELPLARPPGSVERPRFQRRSARVEPTIWSALERLTRKAGLTPSAVLLAAYAEVVGTWSRRPRFTLNLTLFNRLPLHPQVGEIVGDFTSVILLEVDRSRPASFADRARQLQQQLLRDMDHRHFSGVRFLRELARAQGDAPRALMPVVFTSGLALGEQGQGASALRPLGTMVYGINQTPQVWLDLQVLEQGDAVVLNWDAVEELFPAGLLDDMFGAYVRGLEQLAASEEAWHGAARTWVPSDHLAQRAAVNDTTAPVSGELLQTLFTRKAAEQPGACAILDGEVSLSYGELLALASGLGHRLRRAGARPNTLVAVVMEKGWEQAVAVLGVLMSGAAYLPVDPELPWERRQYLLEQGEVRLALTQPRLAARLEWPAGVERIEVVREPPPAQEAVPPALVQGPRDLAYVIYTSGSTGLPKGVMIDHQGAVNTILDINRRFAVGPRDRVLALSSLSFDLSVYDLFGTLAAGGAVVFPAATGARDPAHWLEVARRHGVTVWDSVPGSMQMVVEYLAHRPELALPPLRLAMLSGDWIPVNLPARAQGLWKGLRVVSLGGATEASIWSIFHDIDRVEPEWKSIPYGKPLTLQRFEVLDEQLEPVPVWVPGNLFIGGVGLAKGYWRDEERTRASFITHPRTGERLYRTGDLGRYWPDGSIEFLGREDLQVKVGGYRIELGEIEAALQRHPEVKEVAVCAVGEPGGSRRMVAYVAPREGQASAPHVSSAEELSSRNGQEEARVLLDPIARLEFKLKQPGIQPLPAESPRVALPGREADEARVREFLARQSHREFLEERVPLEELGRLLGALQSIPIPGAPLPKYLYPSAGSLYPVQTYAYLKADRVEGLSGGFYYYHPVEHCLVKLGSAETLTGEDYGDYNQALFEAASFSLFLVGALDAIEPLYGAVARDYCLLEAGYIGQMLMSRASALRLGLCPIGAVAFEEKVRGALGLEPRKLLLHGFVGGRIDEARARTWLQPRATPAPDTLVTRLRGYLREKLPEYMIPSSWVVRDALPRSANGKLDRKALLESEPTSVAPAGERVAPRTELERELWEFWCEVLGVSECGVHDSFFERGGDSMLATRLVALVRERFNVDVPLGTFFKSPTIEAMARYIEVVRWAVSADPAAEPASSRNEELEF